MDQVVASSMTRLSLTMLLLGIAATVALILSAVGIYGVISYIVGRRRAEIGLRMALGARPSQAGSFVMLQSLRFTGAGIAIGLLGAVATTRLLCSVLFGISPNDPLTFLAVSLLMLVIAVLASYVPTRRAMQVDPVEALRAD
jgi:ABC-type antimicrobial peptide transport system permease subunit